MNDRLKIIGLPCRPMDMPPVKIVQPILPAEHPMPQRHLTVLPISTNYQPLHVQTTAPNQPPPVSANGIIWANGHSWQNADHNNNFLPPRAIPPQFHGPAPTSTSLRMNMPPTCQFERTHPFHRPPNPIMDPWRPKEAMTNLPPTPWPIPAICAPIGHNESFREVSNTTCVSIEGSGEKHAKETGKHSSIEKVLVDNKSVLRKCLELNGIYPEKAPSVSDALTETKVIGKIKIEELSPIQDTCIRHKDYIASPSGSDTPYYETSDPSDCSTNTKTASLTSDTVYRHSSNE